MGMIFANDLPFRDEHLDPLRSIGDSLAFAADDWGDSRAKAWIYGIVLGWDDEDGSESAAMDELAIRHRWDAATVARLRALHAAWKRLEAEAARP